MKKGTPMTRSQAKKAGIATTAGLALVAMAGVTTLWEGKRNAPYYDSVGVKTVCYGETRVQMRTYTDAECKVLFQEGAKEFLTAVRRRNPGIINDPYIWAAHGSLAYNIGVKAYNGSSVAKLYAAGDKLGSCNAIGKYQYAGGKVLKGLVLRRQGDATRMGEIELCKFQG